MIRVLIVCLLITGGGVGRSAGTLPLYTVRGGVGAYAPAPAHTVYLPMVVR